MCANSGPGPSKMRYVDVSRPGNRRLSSRLCPTNFEKFVFIVTTRATKRANSLKSRGRMFILIEFPAFTVWELPCTERHRGSQKLRHLGGYSHQFVQYTMLSLAAQTDFTHEYFGTNAFFLLEVWVEISAARPGCAMAVT